MLNKKKGGILFVVSGPSGSGKTTLVEKLISSKKFKGSLIKSVSFTTRKPRDGEKKGVDYNFVSEKDFFSMRKRGDFFEWTKYNGAYYATSKKLVREKLARGKSIIFSIDVRGAFNVKKFFKGKKTLIFIMPPSLDILQKRLMKRNSEKSKTCLERLRIAKREMKSAGKYDYIVINNKLKQTIKQLSKIIEDDLKNKNIGRNSKQLNYTLR